MNYLKLIRWKNILLIALTQYLIKYALLEPFGALTTLSDFSFFLLVLSTLCLAAAGYIINDIHDVEADLINKPDDVIIDKHISEKTAFNLFIALNFIGVVIGCYLALSINHKEYFPLFVVISAVLYVYSSFLKQYPVVGNAVISGVVAMSILIVGVFELIPSTIYDNWETQNTFLDLVKDYAIFAFMINFIRELVKDIEDVDGDHKMGYNTLPIAIGRERASKITFVLSLIPIGVISYYLATYLYKQEIAVIYFLALIIAPLIYASIKLFNAETKAHYKHISLILKLVMLTGVLSLLLYQFILK